MANTANLGIYLTPSSDQVDVADITDGFQAIDAILNTTTPSTQAVGDSASAGGDTTHAALASHKHAITAASADITTAAFGDAAAGGSATTFPRGDHRHGMPSFGAVTAVANGDASANGVATTPSRSDHNHGLAAFGAVTAISTFGASSTNGAATTYSRSDHNHGSPTVAAWTSWTPGLDQNGAVAITSSASSYAVIGKTAFVRIYFVVNASGSSGNVLKITGVPAAVAPIGTGAFRILGSGIYVRTGVSHRYVSLMEATSSSTLSFIGAEANYLGSDTAFAAASTDVVSAMLTYEIA